jgi:GNAT superfamily N-acetyltransferase
VSGEPQVAIDAATPADVPELLALIRGLAEYERLADQVEASEARLVHALFGERPAAEALLARAGGEAVGFALFFTNYSTFLTRPGLYLEDLFVLPAWRGKGIGRRLLSRLARVAVERECGRFEWAVLDWNEPAIRFYESLGARALSDWTLYRLQGDALRQLAAESTA